MTTTSSISTRRPIALALVAAGCILAALLTTVLAAPLSASWGLAVTLVALAVMWMIAIGGVIIWRRFAPASDLGIKRLGPRDAVIAVVAGLLLSVTVPLLSLVAAQLAGLETGTVETASRLGVAIAAVGVVTAAFAEEIIYRAIAMGALTALRAPTVIVLLVPAILFTLTHWSWGLAHTAFVVFPLSLALGALYLWRRSLPVNIIAHLIIDLPIVVLAAVATP